MHARFVEARCWGWVESEDKRYSQSRYWAQVQISPETSLKFHTVVHFGKLRITQSVQYVTTTIKYL